MLFVSCVLFLLFFFFFKQKTAYEMRISDWSSDVCSSDLAPAVFQFGADRPANAVGADADGAGPGRRQQPRRPDRQHQRGGSGAGGGGYEIGRASCRERVCQYV